MSVESLLKSISDPKTTSIDIFQEEFGSLIVVNKKNPIRNALKSLSLFRFS
jgi:hypothetical protein